MDRAVLTKDENLSAPSRDAGLLACGARSIDQTRTGEKSMSSSRRHVNANRAR